jgi:hypothetical protein
VDYEEDPEDSEEEDDCMTEERDPIYEPSVARQRHLERQQQRRRQHMVLPPSRQCRELRRNCATSKTFSPPRWSFIDKAPPCNRPHSAPLCC